MSLAESVDDAGWKGSVRADTSGISRGGFLIVGGFMALFGAWAMFFPLASAVVAGGSVISAGKNKLIQHPVGGAVSKIHAVDGEEVRQGEPIVTLDPIVNKAELGQLRARQGTLKAIEARIIARLSGADSVEFPQEFYGQVSNSSNDPAALSPALQMHYRKLIADETDTFQSGRKRIEEEVAAYRQQVQSLRKQVVGFDARRASAEGQLAILRDQERRMRPLVLEGYVARNQLNEIERQVNEFEGTATNLGAEILSTEHRISEIENRITQTIQANREELGNELARVRGEIAELENQLRAVGDSVSKREIRAPVSGIVAKSNVHTIGGVVRPGDVIAEIVPLGSEPMIEARVRPQDIDYVQAGQKAEVIVTAFNRRLYDPIKAEVAYVEADSQTEERTQEKYFIVRLKITDDASQFNRISDIRAGMEGEIYIQTEGRTFMSYALKPISDSYRRAFQER